MATITDQAICIRHWDFSETSQTVSLFTREHGVLRGLAKGARREKGPFSGGIELLTRGEVVAIIKPGRDLATLASWGLSEVFSSLRRSLEAARVGFYFADLVHRMVSDHDPHMRLFEAMRGALRSLESGDERAASLVRFQWALLDETGYRPVLDRDTDTGKELQGTDPLGFSPRAGGVLAHTDGPGTWRVRAATVAHLRAVEREPDSASADLVTTRRAARLLAAYLREIIGTQPPTLRWVFPDLAV